jgi:hypothetical protein
VDGGGGGRAALRPLRTPAIACFALTALGLAAWSMTDWFLFRATDAGTALLLGRARNAEAILAAAFLLFALWSTRGRRTRGLLLALRPLAAIALDSTIGTVGVRFQPWGPGLVRTTPFLVGWIALGAAYVSSGIYHLATGVRAVLAADRALGRLLVLVILTPFANIAVGSGTNVVYGLLRVPDPPPLSSFLSISGFAFLAAAHRPTPTPP